MTECMIKAQDDGAKITATGVENDMLIFIPLAVEHVFESEWTNEHPSTVQTVIWSTYHS